MRLGRICFQRGCQGRGPDKGLWLWFPSPATFPGGPRWGCPGLSSPSSLIAYIPLEASPPGWWAGQHLPVHGPPFRSAPRSWQWVPGLHWLPWSRPTSAWLSWAVQGPPFTSCISTAHAGLGPDRAMFNPEDWRPKARVEGISGEKSKWSILPTIPGRHLSTCSLQKAVLGQGLFPHRKVTIQLAVLARPQFPHLTNGSTYICLAES